MDNVKMEKMDELVLKLQVRMEDEFGSVDDEVLGQAKTKIFSDFTERILRGEVIGYAEGIAMYYGDKQRDRMKRFIMKFVKDYMRDSGVVL